MKAPIPTVAATRSLPVTRPETSAATRSATHSGQTAPGTARLANHGAKQSKKGGAP